MSDENQTPDQPTEVSNEPTVQEIISNTEARRHPVGSPEFLEALAPKTEPATEDKTEEETKTEDVQPEKRKRGIEKRFHELTQERDQERRRAAELEAELNRVRSESAPAKEQDQPQPKAQPEQNSTDRPKIEDFEYVEDYHDALVEWKLEQRELKRVQEERAKEAEQEAKTVIQTWEQREAKVKEEVDGAYDIVVHPAFMETFSKKVASVDSMRFLLESEVGPRILFELADDDTLLEDFKSKPTHRQIAMLTKLEEKFSQPVQKTEEPKSKAPAPAKPLQASRAPVATSDPSKGFKDFKEFLKWRNKK